jgi:hypothetical protein
MICANSCREDRGARHAFRFGAEEATVIPGWVGDGIPELVPVQGAERLGGIAQARRMQLARAIERVGKELGLEDEEPAP